MKKLHLTASMLALIIVALLSAVTLLKFSYVPFIQVFVLIGFGIFYILWSIFHHRMDKSLTLEVFLEYLLTAGLVFILLAGTLVYQ